MSDATDAALVAQYEALPYPARDPRDEDRRLVIGSPSHVLEIDHYVFGGRRDWSRPFRALVAGGGTGDGAIMLAQQLADRGCPAELVHLDLSAAAQAIARARAERRGLTNLRFVQGSLLELPALGLGSFDYVDCCGVLHHLADPAAGLGALTAALAPDGGMGLMVYGEYGRSGVYEMQALLRTVAGEGSPRERVQRARKLLAELPPTNRLVRNPIVADHKEGGDAGLFDLLLHPRDRAYTVPQVADLVSGAGLRLVTFIEPGRYDPLRHLRDPGLRRAIEPLDDLARAAAAEQLTGAMARHVVYVVRADNPVRPAALDAEDAVPALRGLSPEGLARALGTQGVLAAGDAALRMRAPVPRSAGAIVAKIDGRTLLRDLRAALAETLRVADLDRDIRETVEALIAFNLALVRYGS